MDRITVPLNNQEVINNIVGLVKASSDNPKPLFTPRNISSIFHGMGGGALIEAAEALFLSKYEIFTLMKPTNEGGLGFTPANISSILNGAGNNVGKAVEALSASKDKIAELMKPINEGGLGFTINQIKIKLFGVKSSFDLNNAEIEEFESEELLHRPSSEVSQLGKRRRDLSDSSSESQVRNVRQRS